MTQGSSATRGQSQGRSRFDLTGFDQTLLWLLARAGDRWGAARVAAAAAALTRPDDNPHGSPRVVPGSPPSWVKTYHPAHSRQYRG